MAQWKSLNQCYSQNSELLSRCSWFSASAKRIKCGGRRRVCVWGVWGGVAIADFLFSRRLLLPSVGGSFSLAAALMSVTEWVLNATEQQKNTDKETKACTAENNGVCVWQGNEGKGNNGNATTVVIRKLVSQRSVLTGATELGGGKLQRRADQAEDEVDVKNSLHEGNARARTQTNGCLFSPYRLLCYTEKLLASLPLTTAGSHLTKRKEKKNFLFSPPS